MVPTTTHTTKTTNSFEEIDDVQIGDIVYIPFLSGAAHSVEGQTVSYRGAKVERYYKLGYEDRAIVSYLDGSGEGRIRHNSIQGFWCDIHGYTRLSSRPIEPKTQSICWWVTD